MTLFYIPCATKKEALRIGRALLEDRLAACINVHGPTESLYWWNVGSQTSLTSRTSKTGKKSASHIAHDREYILLVKTAPQLAGRVEKRVRALHSYSIPCIARINARANTEFERWTRGEVD